MPVTRRRAGAAASGAAASAPVLLLAPEDLRTVAVGAAGGGPVITGSVQPEKRADLRAEVAAVVTQVLKDNGEPVRRGDLLMRLDDTSIRESLQSADASARAAAQAFEQAERAVQRLKTLQGQGMTSIQALEDAEVRRNSAQSELVAARARVASAQQQLRRTEVRAPFDGVVSERKASVGDTAADRQGTGQGDRPARACASRAWSRPTACTRSRSARRCRSASTAFPTSEFAGKVRRIDAAANATTRQVELIVDFVDPRQGAARGRPVRRRPHRAAPRRACCCSPRVAIVRDGAQAAVWRVKDGRIAKVAVQLGERDERRGEYPVSGGLAGGDVILRNPGSALIEGQKVEFAKALPASAAATTAREVGGRHVPVRLQHQAAGGDGRDHHRADGRWACWR